MVEPPSSPLPPGSRAESSPEFEQVYRQLRALASRMLDGERANHTLQATALVHEAWLSLLGGSTELANDPLRFHRLAAQAMRRVLIDHARGRGRQKRGGGKAKIPLDALALAGRGDDAEILAVDDAIERLATTHPELADLVRLRFFTGLSVEDAAKALGMSVRSVHREWTTARALLAAQLEPGR